MRSLETDPWSTCLAGSKSEGDEITVRRYAKMHANTDRSGIASLIRRRFEERFLHPILDNPKRHGFAMMGICCLMVETLESFRNGWKNTSEKGKSEAAFCRFFQAHDEFKQLRPVAHEFYRAVRCGILHQAESTRRLARGPRARALRGEGRGSLAERLRVRPAAEGCAQPLPRRVVRLRVEQRALGERTQEAPSDLSKLWTA